MSPVRQAPTPRGVLYRIAHLPDPLAWVPWELAGGGRFDDPQGQFRVLYAAAQRRGAFVETLARFRPAIESLAQPWQLAAGTAPAPAANISADWYEKRGIAEFRLSPGQRWLDLRAPETREELRAALANTLLTLGLSDLDLSRVVGPRRSFTQAIARWPTSTAMPEWPTPAGWTRGSPSGQCLKARPLNPWACQSHSLPTIRTSLP